MPPTISDRLGWARAFDDAFDAPVCARTWPRAPAGSRFRRAANMSHRARSGLPDAAPSGALAAAARTRAARAARRDPDRRPGRWPVPLAARPLHAGEPHPGTRHGVRLLDALDGARAPAGRPDLDDRPRHARAPRSRSYFPAGRASPSGSRSSISPRSTSSNRSRSATSTSSSSTRSRREYAAYLELGRPDAQAFRASSSSTTCCGAGRSAARPKSSDDESTKAIRAFNKTFLNHPQLDATIVPIGDGIGIGARVD